MNSRGQLRGPSLFDVAEPPVQEGPGPDQQEYRDDQVADVVKGDLGDPGGDGVAQFGLVVQHTDQFDAADDQRDGHRAAGGGEVVVDLADRSDERPLIGGPHEAPSRVSNSLIPDANNSGSTMTAYQGNPVAAPAPARTRSEIDVAVSNPRPNRNPRGYIWPGRLIAFIAGRSRRAKAPREFNASSRASSSYPPVCASRHTR